MLACIPCVNNSFYIYIIIYFWNVVLERSRKKISNLVKNNNLATHQIYTAIGSNQQFTFRNKSTNQICIKAVHKLSKIRNLSTNAFCRVYKLNIPANNNSTCYAFTEFCCGSFSIILVQMYCFTIFKLNKYLHLCIFMYIGHIVGYLFTYNWVNRSNIECAFLLTIYAIQMGTGL